jgi:hypothetical protein
MNRPIAVSLGAAVPLARRSPTRLMANAAQLTARMATTAMMMRSRLCW